MNRLLDQRLAVVFFVLISAVPADAGAQSASGLFDKMTGAEAKRAKGVSDYAMDITMMGHDSTLYYERVTIPQTNRRPVETFRLVPFDEMKSRQEAGQGMPPDAWQAYSDALRQSGSAMDSEIDREMSEAGFPPGLLDAMGSGASEEPWASPNPGTMMNSMADFAAAGSGASSKGKDEADAEQAAMAESMSQFRKHAKIVGKETIGKTRTVHTRAENLELVEEVNGEEITIHTVSLWIDAANYVPVKLRIDGTARQKRKSREFFVERLDQDYRTVPDSTLYMPYRNVLRVGGVLGPKEQREMEDARKKLADFEAQLAAMQPEERARVEGMMGSQMDMMRKMVDGGTMEIETTVRAIRVNTGLAGATPQAGRSQPASSAAPTAPTAPPTSADFVVQSIQRDLSTLGYDPGNTDGELSTATVIAISKFQAENGLDVTGEATPQLAGILAAKRDSATAAKGSVKSPEDAQAVCLQEKIDAAKKKKRAFGKVMKAAANTTTRYGGTKVSTEVEKASREAYRVDATAKDVDEVAKELGISSDDVEACRNTK
jgi:peptidoglycan hydrolase-like protein with peptidoglycan-binding domain